MWSRAVTVRVHGIAISYVAKYAFATRDHSFGISGTSSGSNSSGWRVERFDGLLRLGKLPDLIGGVKACGEVGWLPPPVRADCILLGAMAWSLWMT